jgi:hypothetical protein
MLGDAKSRPVPILDYQPQSCSRTRSGAGALFSALGLAGIVAVMLSVELMLVVISGLWTQGHLDQAPLSALGGAVVASVVFVGSSGAMFWWWNLGDTKST